MKGGAVFAAPLTNVPKTLTQPDGMQIACFASGDKFFSLFARQKRKYHRYEYGNGMVYLFGGEAEFITGTRTAPSIPVPADLQEIYHTAAIDLGARYVDISSDAKKVSHNAFDIESSFVTSDKTGAATTALSYQTNTPRSYYQPWSVSNPTGVNGEQDRYNREMALLEEALLSVRTQVPRDLELDYNGDGKVDNITFILSGTTGDWGNLLWPHSWALQRNVLLINGKRAFQFNLNFAKL